ncbi:polymorphic toxin-type HINT domain-containing protein [Kribbella caucasensis]|uniref:polymorphic toxin-type HINT domain-containing protein n=1 Tax=Kribbella caucasensis TaxID=2512215 RepID=UPI001414CD0C|nr:polymorphic toxin-type HINT domain-containing protein [Kribbella sp. VKM Ac-2527]
MSKGLAFALVAAVPLTAADYGTAAADLTAAGKPPDHRAQPAPEQREGSADGQPQVIGENVNKTVPTSLKGRYPDLNLGTSVPKATNATRPLSEPAKPVTGFDSRTSRELPAKRDRYKTTYANADGTETTVVSTTPSNYRLANGSWAPVRTTLSRQDLVSGDGWRSTGDSVTSSLSTQVTPDRPVAELTLAGGEKVGWGVLNGTSVSGKTKGANTVEYSGFAPGADLELTVEPGGIKETVVLRSKASARSYVFPLHLQGLKAELRGQDIALIDAQGNEKASIPAGFMVDGKSATSSGVNYSLIDSPTGQALRVELDNRWLDDPARAYPVRVDPTVKEVKFTEALTVRDSGSYLGTSDFMVGRRAGNRSAAYLRFVMPTELRYHTVYGAQLQVNSYSAPSCTPRPVTVYPVTASWTASTSLTYPGPTVGAALTSKSFAQGFIASGSTTTKCKPVPTSFNLGAAGAALVQRWVDDAAANKGLSLRAPVTDDSSWKEFAGVGTENPPKLFITHTPYNAKYTITGAPNPPVLQNQDGKVKITVKNLSAEAWAPSQYYLKTVVTDMSNRQLYQYRGANLPTTLPRGASVTLDALVKAMSAGTGSKQYRVYFTMVRVGGPDFSMEQVKPASIAIEVRNLPPVVDQLSPDNGYRTQTLTPQLWGRAFDIDAPTSGITYSFEVCEKTSAGTYVGCFSSAYQSASNWDIPAAKLSWNKEYAWRLSAKDTNGAVTVSPPAPQRMALLTEVPQPAITARLANAPYGSGDRPFDPNLGNHLTSAVDVSVPVAGPELDVVRTYNSLDPRRTGVFGAGWSSKYDLKLVVEPEGSVLATYPDGQQVRFGKNPDGTYVGPSGRQAQLTFDSSVSNWLLKDGNANTYTFSLSGKLNQIKGRWGKPMLFEYGGDGKLTKVTSQQGNNRALTFTWNGTHIASVSTAAVDGAPLKVTYNYTGDLLTSVCAPDGKCTTYGSAQGSHYRSAVIDSQPASYYRLNDEDGPAQSQVTLNFGKDNGAYQGVTRNVTGGIAGSSDTATTFTGATAPSYVSLPNGAIRRDRGQSIELWFKILGKGLVNPLIGYQNKAIDQASTTGMPILYVGSDGLLRGQFWNGAAAPISTVSPVDEGNWHHVVLSSTGSAQTLYLDGAVVGTSTGRNVDHANMVVNQVGAAYAVAPGAWPGWGTALRQYLKGSIDEVAVYSRPLSAAVVASHYQLGKNPSDQLTSVTQPSGKVISSAAYDTSTERVKEFTDDDGGLWKISAPELTGGASDLRRTVEVRDPADRRYFYEYDGIGGWLLRSGVPNGLGTREEDLPPAPTPTPSPTTCSTPDPGDPEFCIVTPGSGSQDPIFDWHALDGIAVRSFEYDKAGQLLKTTNEVGETVTLGYDAKGNNTSQTTCRSGSTDCRTSYETFPTTGLTDPLDPRWGLPTESRDGRASGPTDNTFKTTYTYVPQGELSTQTSTDAGTIENTYTNGSEVGPTGVMPSGLVRTTKDARGAVTTYSYHSTGQLAKITTPTGLSTSFTYDAVGRKISQTQVSDSQPAGVTTTFTYDTASRLSTTTGPVTTDKVTGAKHQQKVTLTYDDDGNLVTQETVDLQAGGEPRRTTYSFDDRNRLERQTDAAGNEVSYEYDAFGNRTAMTDAGGNRYEYAYTARNMIAEVRLRDPDGTGDSAYKVMRSFGYDQTGRVVRETDTMGRTVQYLYYGDGLLKSKILKEFHNPDGSKRDFVLETNTYDGAGNLLTQVTDNGKNTISYTRDGAGRVKTSTVDPGGLNRTTAMTYDLGGKVLSTVETGEYSNTHWLVSGQQRKTTFGYDTAGRQTSQTQWLDATRGLTTSWTYDQRSLQTSATSPRGNESGAVKADFTSTYGYDELGRQDVVTQPKVQVEEDGQPAVAASPVVQVGYDAYGMAVSTKDALGNVGRTTFDKLGLPIETTGPTYTPPGGTAITPNVRSEYDANGNILKITDARGNETKFGYDRQNRLVRKDQPVGTNADRAVWSYEYTGNGDLKTVIDPLGGRSESTYDDLDRVITTTQVERKPVTDNFVTRFSYDDADRLVSTVSPTGATSTTTYDTLGQPTKVTDPASVVTQFGYDFLGRQVEQVDGLGRMTTAGYDLADRLLESTDLDAAQTQLRKTVYTFDADGNVLTAKPPVGGPTTYTYDALSRLVGQQEKVSATQSITTSLGYDAAGNQTRYTDGRGNSTYTTVNSLGLTESVIEPSTVAHPAAADRTWTTSYDAVGNAVRLAEPGGVTRVRTFDAAGRLTDEAGSGTGVQAAARKIGYDALGRVTSINSVGADNTYTYNDRGQVLTSTGPSGSASFSFNADGALVQRADASGTADFGYTQGRLTSITDSVTRTAQTVGYDNAGAPKTIGYGLGRTRTFEYDDLGRLKSDGLKNSAGTTVSSVTYSFDLDDRLAGKTTTGVQGAGANTYTYDDAGRLKTWTGAGKTTSYGWDDAGNRTQVDGTTARYDERNRLVTDGSADYSYSARGTLTSKTTGSTTESTKFDAFDRAIEQGGRAYQYDGADRPVTGGGTTMQYAGFSDEVVADGTQLYGHGVSDNVISLAQGQTERLLLSDGRTDITGGFDPTDAALTGLPDSRTYDPFGKELSTGGLKYGVGYQSDWSDPATGNVNMGARWYDPDSGTFTSRDTISYSGGSSTTANKYLYGNANPLTNYDPTGNYAVDPYGQVKQVCKDVPNKNDGRGHKRSGDGFNATHASYSTSSGGGTHVKCTWTGGTIGKDDCEYGPCPIDPPKVPPCPKKPCPKPVDPPDDRDDPTPTPTQHPRPKPKPVDPAIKARNQLENNVKNNPRPNAAGVAVPLISQGNPTGGGTSQNMINDTRGQIDQIYQQAVQSVGPVVQNAPPPFNPFPDPFQKSNYGGPKKHTGFFEGLKAGWEDNKKLFGGAAKFLWENKSEIGHAALDVVGLIPVVGEVADLANAGWYAAEGDYVNAALSAASAIPVAGYAATAAKGARYVNKGIKAGKDARTLGKTAERAGLPSCKCFPAGTTVDTAAGAKPIEQIKVGDRVWARDQITGKSRLQKVTSLFRKQTNELLTIKLAGGGEVPVTSEHPFYTPDRGWLESGDLKPGDKLLQRDGKTAVVAAITHSPITTTVYNFSVENDHNYYVGPSSLLVHNCPPPPITVDRHGNLTNGKFTLSEQMVKHTGGVPGKSIFLFHVNSGKAVLDAAAYADAYKLWNKAGTKAKVYVENGPVGVLGRTGELTDWINVYRDPKSNFVHGSPGSPR